MSIVKDTQDIRNKMLHIWKLVDEKKVTSAEARLHMGLARTILDTLKVEIAAAHLQGQIPAVAVRDIRPRPMKIVERKAQ